VIDNSAVMTIDSNPVTGCAIGSTGGEVGTRVDDVVVLTVVVVSGTEVVGSVVVDSTGDDVVVLSDGSEVVVDEGS
jgi:hypothetical protein